LVWSFIKEPPPKAHRPPIGAARRFELGVSLSGARFFAPRVLASLLGPAQRVNPF
jgi:hypothetical protein